MTITDGANLELSVTVRADEEVDLVVLLREVANQIKNGGVSGVVGGCIGSAHYEITEQILGKSRLDKVKTC